ncbi:unnamed protein product, partial [Symbiodinium natans]
KLVVQKNVTQPHTWPAICRETLQAAVKHCVAGAQLLNLAAFLFRDWVTKDDVPAVKADTLVYKILLFANPLFSPGWTVIKVFRGSFTHAVAK